jgi:hypothetical protein
MGINLYFAIERKKSSLAATSELLIGLTFVIPCCKEIIAKVNLSFNENLGKEGCNAYKF